MRFSQKELFDLSKAWLALSLAFAIVLGGLSENLLQAFIISAFTVGIGFIFHELGHKYSAQYFNHGAEFRSFDAMLLLAILMSFLGFIIAAPGAVVLHGYINKKEHGMISASGIGASLLAALIFFVLSFFTGEGLLGTIAAYGVFINSWLAIFNLIPLGIFDGSKVFRWNKGVYFILLIIGLSMIFSAYL